jgi:hypothetical protein
MVRAERQQLTGNVGIDETFVGGIEHGGKRGRYISNASGSSLIPFLIRKDRQPNPEKPLKTNLSGVTVKHLPNREK